MLKPLTLSLSLALALGLTGVSKAGLFHNDGGCSTCGLASPQGPVVSPQAPMASPQVVECAPACETGGGCNFLKKCGHGLKGMGHGFGSLCQKLKPKPACYTYEWVLKKKKVKHHGGGCGTPSCDTCASGPAIYPSSQVLPAPQGGVAPAPQAYPAPQASYGSGQAAMTASAAGLMTPAPSAPAGDEAPPAPEVGARGPQSSLLFSTPSGN